MIRTVIFDENQNVINVIDWKNDNDAKAFMFDAMQGIEQDDKDETWYYECLLENCFTYENKQYDEFGMYLDYIDRF